MFSVIPTVKRLNVVSTPRAKRNLSGFFRKLVAGRTDVLYVDVESALCNGYDAPSGKMTRRIISIVII